jgi:hypothetical protein
VFFFRLRSVGIYLFYDKTNLHYLHNSLSMCSLEMFGI